MTTNQIHHLVKRRSIKDVILFSMSCRMSKKRLLIFGPTGANRLRTSLSSAGLVIVILHPQPQPKRGTSQARHRAPGARERKGWYSENLNFCFLTESLSGNMHHAASSSLQIQSMLCTAPLYRGLKTRGIGMCSKS